MTHEQATARYPHREVFASAGQSVSDWGKPFRLALERSRGLGLIHIHAEGVGPPEPAEPDGMIIPGAHDGDATVLPKFPYLGTVTLYWNDRKEVAVAR